MAYPKGRPLSPEHRKKLRRATCAFLPCDLPPTNWNGKKHYQHCSREHMLLHNRDKHLTRAYGITLDKYNVILAKQGGCCAICRTDDPGRGSRGSFPVDHDHETGETRGLLCMHCNRGLGHFDLTTIRAAATYLEEHQ